MAERKELFICVGEPHFLQGYSLCFTKVSLTSFKDIPCVSQSSYSQGKGAVGFEKSIHYTTNEAYYTIDRRH
ncbi:hypothetical protein QL285_081136 [Trifolium repens]|nr:hypothetical protein QL285_081136 [Trifolium repens]